MIIRECVYDVVDTNQGQILIAECLTSFKVVAVYLLDENLDDQITDLHDSYPTVHFIRGTPTQTAAVVQAINTLDTKVKINAVHNGNTVFSTQVYNAIQNIPKGETRSYSDIAREIGNPDAIRAVAGACSRNNLAYIVPCHRVIGSNGNLSGYRWGISKKRSLLLAEGAQLNFAAM